jgi:hypothetical protein
VGEGAFNSALAAEENGHVIATWLHDVGEGDTRVVAATGLVSTEPDRAPPVVTVVRRRRAGRLLVVAVRCSEPCRLRWSASGRVGGRAVMRAGAGRFEGATGEPRAVIARLPRPRRHAKLRLAITATDLAGNATRAVVER